MFVINTEIDMSKIRSIIHVINHILVVAHNEFESSCTTSGVLFQDPDYTIYSIDLLILGRQWMAHWGPGAQICVGNLTIIGSENGLSRGRQQAIIWTNAGILLFWP